MLDIANTYHGFWSKLQYLDFWYTPPVPADTPRRVSQHWHRDYDDRHLLKVFIYLVDVDDDTGPFEFIPGSEPGGPYGELWPWRPAGAGSVAQPLEKDVVMTFAAVDRETQDHQNLQHRRVTLAALL